MLTTCAMCGEQFKTNRKARVYCSRTCSNRATGDARAEQEITDRLYSVWSSGGGIQSTAIAALIETGQLPKPDFGIMVDCGYEKQSTLQYMYEVTIPKMKKAGVHFEILDTLKYTNNDLTDGKGHVNIPAFRLKPDGKVSKLYTHCNNTWKVRVTRKWMREQGINYCENWIGISIDEQQRARSSALKWIKLRYPLIELGMTREQCIYEIARAGWPMPQRSSCVFCPQQDKRAWETTRAHYPDDWRRALAAERLIRAEAPDVYMHKDCKLLEELFP